MALRGAAAQGLGIALLPRQLVGPALDEGELVAVLEGQVGLDVSLSLVWIEREFIDPKVRAFVDLAVESVSDGRWDMGSSRASRRG